MVNTVYIRIDKEDDVKLMGICKDLFLKEHHEMKGMIISRRFMIKKIVEHIIGDG